MRSSAGAVAGSRRRASANQCAALAGASRTASSPASRRTAAASTSPSRAERSTWWARAAAGAPRVASALGAPLVRTEPPAAGASTHRLPVGRAGAGSGSAAARRCARTRSSFRSSSRHSIADSLCRRSGGGRQLGLERIARDRRPFQDEACGLGQEAQLFAQRGGNRGGTSIAGQRRPRRPRRTPHRVVERARELLEIERVAAALLVER